MEKTAICKKTGELVLIREHFLYSEVIFEVDGKDFKYLKAELGPHTDFEVIGEL